VLEPAAAAELERALAALQALVLLRLEERRATTAGPRLDALIARPLGQDGGEGLPPPEAFAGTGPLAQLVETYELTPAETVAVLAAVAPEVDEKFDLLLGALADRPADGLTGEGLRNLLARSFAGRLDAADLLAPDGKLCALAMLVVESSPAGALAGRVRANPELAQWLLGRARHEPELTTEFPAQRLRTVHTFDDLVVPDDVRERLRLVLARVRDRRRLVVDYGFGEHHDNAAGFHVLFHGPPGTGKTMAAAVVGRETGLPVYRIDISALVSKYIGETEKSLSRIFARAEAHDWILFFDEADAVFGRRGEVDDARDRYANQEVSYLLQRIETFAGVTILATNFLRNVDVAFLRRLHVVVPFAEPTLEEREELWSRAFPPAVPLAPDLDLVALADEYELTGGEIRNAVLDASARACADGGIVTPGHVQASIRGEYEKNGRMFPR
jgi:AAA+ superfamily predicted ATPase